MNIELLNFFVRYLGATLVFLFIDRSEPAVRISSDPRSNHLMEELVKIGYRMCFWSSLIIYL